MGIQTPADFEPPLRYLWRSCLKPNYSDTLYEKLRERGLVGGASRREEAPLSASRTEYLTEF